MYFVIWILSSWSPKLKTSVEPTEYLFYLGILQSILIKLRGSLGDLCILFRFIPALILSSPIVIGPKVPLILAILSDLYNYKYRNVDWTI